MTTKLFWTKKRLDRLRASLRTGFRLSDTFQTASTCVVNDNRETGLELVVLPSNYAQSQLAWVPQPTRVDDRPVHISSFEPASCLTDLPVNVAFLFAVFQMGASLNQQLESQRQP